MSGFNFGTSLGTTTSSSQSTSPFGSSASAFSSSSLFGSSSAPASASSGFGSGSSPFGFAPPSNPSTSSSPFSFSNPTSSPAFGTPNPNPNPSPFPSFGAPSSSASTTTASSAPSFGFNPSTAASASSPFGASLFGASSSAQTSGSTTTLFGSTVSASTPATTTSPLFGSAPSFGTTTTTSPFAPTTAAAQFGSTSSAAPPSSTTQNLFGSSAPSSAAPTTPSFPSFSTSAPSAASSTPAFASFLSSSSAAATAAPAFSTAPTPAFPSFSSSSSATASTTPSFAGFSSASSAAPATSSSGFSAFPSSAPAKPAASTTAPGLSLSFGNAASSASSASQPVFGFSNAASSASSASQPAFGFSNAAASSAAPASSASLSFSKPSVPLFSTVTTATTTTAASTPAASSTTQAPFSLSAFNVTPSAPPAASTTTPPASTAVPASSAAATTTSSFTGFSLTPASSAATASSGPSIFSSATGAASSSQAQPSTSLAAFGLTTSATATTAATTSTTGASTPAAQTSTALAVASTSGTSSNVNGSTTVSTTPKLPSEITGKTVEENIKEWNAELQELTGKFRKQANAIADWDRRILQNPDVLLRLEIEVAYVVDTQAKVERQLELIETHQQDVDNALQSMEEEAERIYKDERGLLLDDEAASTRDAMYEQAEYVERELEQVTEQIKSIIETVNADQDGDLDLSEGMAFNVTPSAPAAASTTPPPADVGQDSETAPIQPVNDPALQAAVGGENIPLDPEVVILEVEDATPPSSYITITDAGESLNVLANPILDNPPEPQEEQPPVGPLPDTSSIPEVNEIPYATRNGEASGEQALVVVLPSQQIQTAAVPESPAKTPTPRSLKRITSIPPLGEDPLLKLPTPKRDPPEVREAWSFMQQLGRLDPADAEVAARIHSSVQTLQGLVDHLPSQAQSEVKNLLATLPELLNFLQDSLGALPNQQAKSQDSIAALTSAVNEYSTLVSAANDDDEDEIARLEREKEALDKKIALVRARQAERLQHASDKRALLTDLQNETQQAQTEEEELVDYIDHLRTKIGRIGMNLYELKKLPAK